jgi:L-ascorbate metabolism protein UlaG (beta-lactamase superfamily)
MKIKGIALLSIIVLLFYIFITMFSEKLNYPKSDHYDQNKFYNQNPSVGPKGFASVLKWKLTSSSQKWPERIVIEKDIPPAKVNNGNVRISSVGHATFLIQLKDKNILTDPVWSERASPFKSIGPKRISQSGIDFDKLPRIDIVLISHNHYDHLDTETIKRLWNHSAPVFIAPLGNQTIIKKAVPKALVYDLDWYQNMAIDSLKIHLIPSQHWSSRWIIDANKHLWGGFIIESEEGQICFIGDSGYSKDMFEEIGNKFDNIIFAILPIGSYEPRWFMKDVHMNPADALMAFRDLKAKFFIPSHFGVFQLSDESYQKQLNDYEQSIKESGINEEYIITLQPGQFVLKNFLSR